MVKNKKPTAGTTQHLSEVGNYGDQREYYASQYVLEHAPKNTPDAVLAALEQFDLRWTMLHLGKAKGDYLDAAVRDLILERRQQPQQEQQRPIRALEIGAYIGYSAIRIGRILATATASQEPGYAATLVSVEQNRENAGYAQTHVDYAGLTKHVTVLHSRIGDCSFFDNICLPTTTTNAKSKNNDHGQDPSLSVPLCGDADGDDKPPPPPPPRPYDFVFFDHRTAWYLRDLQFLEAQGVIDATRTTVVADNVASLEHVHNRTAAIQRGKRTGPCQCVNKGCDYLAYVRRHWSSTTIYYGTNTKDGISVSKPSSRCLPGG